MIKTGAGLAQCRGAGADGVFNLRSPVNPIRKSVRLACRQASSRADQQAICVLAESVTSDIWLVVSAIILRSILKVFRNGQVLEPG